MTRYWNVGLLNRGLNGIRISASPCRWDWEEQGAWEVKDMDRYHESGELRVTVEAESEEEALERGSHLFCQYAGVWSLDELFRWSAGKKRVYEAESAERKAAWLAAKETVAAPQQASLF